MARSSDIGDGDRCPLFPEHGLMVVLQGSNPPKQYCPHVDHDGHGHGDDAIPASRAIWPLYGLEDTLASYLARLHRAVERAELPDLSGLTLEV